jgi:hypothetical protein
MEDAILLLIIAISFALGYLYRFWLEKHYDCPTCKGRGYIEKKNKAQ